MVATVAALPPEPPQLSLLDMARQPVDVDTAGQPVNDRWIEGFRWAPQACGRISGYNDCGTRHSADYRNDGPTPDSSGRLPFRTHQPVVIQAPYQCSTLGWDWDFYRQSAVAAMLAGEPLAAETELWEGTLARAATGIGFYDSNLWLTKYGVATDMTPTPGTAVKPKVGLAILEGFLSDHGFGGRGMLHLPRELTPHLGVRVDGASLLTNNNTLVVAGVGYTGSGPATSSGGAPSAAPAGTAWAYCTDRVTYRHSEIVLTPDFEGEAVDRSTNTVRVTAERYSAATFDLCAVGAVLISTVDV